MRTKTLIVAIILLFESISVSAQIPYFSSTVGKNKLYGYTSLKARPGINDQESYSTFQYGIADKWSAGMDLYTGRYSTFWGANLRYGYTFSKRLGIGGAVTPSFDLNNNFKLGYITCALYMNGAITDDGKLFWCSNTWYGININSNNTISNYEYLGYTFTLNDNHSITPMVGAIHSWKFDQNIDIAAGFYYTFNHWNLYIWGNDFMKKHPRFIIGIDFILW